MVAVAVVSAAVVAALVVSMSVVVQLAEYLRHGSGYGR